jgi:mono/diheme cytochrome c family protein
MRSSVVSLCAAMALVGLVWVISAADDGNNEVVNRGRYLVEFAGCSECHTPLKMGPNGPEEDTERLFSGHPQDAILPPPPELPPGPWNAITGGMTAWAGPWGISYGSNLTSDPDTGLGAWDRDQFVAALKTGQHLGMGRDILPPMPHYRTVTDEDLEAMFAYFMTVPPIKNEVPDPVPPASGAP